nr:hypothetical protein [Vibrio vulnificus]
MKMVCGRLVYTALTP